MNDTIQNITAAILRLLPAARTAPEYDPTPPPLPENAREHLAHLGRAPLQGWIDQRPEGGVNLRHTDVEETFAKVRQLMAMRDGNRALLRRPRRVK
jgi:hypothetical protein